MADDSRPTLLLDAPSLVYRAFFALPTSLTDPHGTPVNAVRGYLDMVTRLIGDHRPHQVIHAMDADWRPAWRVEAYPGYKANRPPDPPELPGQFEVLYEVLVAAGMPVADATGYEADDVIGTLTAPGTAGHTAVVTGDRDLLQVVRDPEVWMLFPVKGVGQLARFDEAEVAAKYSVPPQRYVDFAILRGDPSDGLPGVRGVGEKTAAKLVSEFESLDELIAAARGERMHALSSRVTAAIREATEYLAAMRVVVPVATAAPVEATPAVPPDVDRLEALAARHGIESPLRRLRKVLAAE